MEYIPDSPNPYTEKMMRKRIHKLWWKLWRHKGFDILVTHAPSYNLNDMEDLPHRGFKAFLDLMDKYHQLPKPLKKLHPLNRLLDFAF